MATDAKSNPVYLAKKWLVECGFTEAEAKNLLRAVQHENQDTLAELIPRWIEHAGNHKLYQTTVIDLAAAGLMNVTVDKDGDLAFSLKVD